MRLPGPQWEATVDLAQITDAGADRRTDDLRWRITRAASVYAVDRASFYRGNLARAMRRALAAGLRREQVIALSVLPREEAEQLIAGS